MLQPPDQLRQLREVLRVSHREMADILGLAGANGNDRMMDMEIGRREITGPLRRGLDQLATTTPLPGGDARNKAFYALLPEFVQLSIPGAAPDGLTELGTYLHTRYPRFVAFSDDRLPKPLLDELEAQGTESVPLGSGRLIGLQIDYTPPTWSIGSLLTRLAAIIEAKR